MFIYNNAHVANWSFTKDGCVETVSENPPVKFLSSWAVNIIKLVGTINQVTTEAWTFYSTVIEIRIAYILGISIGKHFLKDRNEFSNPSVLAVSILFENLVQWCGS